MLTRFAPVVNSVASETPRADGEAVDGGILSLYQDSTDAGAPHRSARYVSLGVLVPIDVWLDE